MQKVMMRLIYRLTGLIFYFYFTIYKFCSDFRFYFNTGEFVKKSAVPHRINTPGKDSDVNVSGGCPSFLDIYICMEPSD